VIPHRRHPGYRVTVASHGRQVGTDMSALSPNRMTLRAALGLKQLPASFGVPRLVKGANHSKKGEEVLHFENRYRHKNGSWRWVESIGTNMLEEPAVRAIVANYRDITDSKQNERRLEDTQRKLRQQQDMLQDVNSKLSELATVDGLTQLRNRRAFEERMEDETRRWRRHGGDVSLVLLDIDNFKEYNDTFGHPKGDEVLRAVGRLLLRSLRASDFAARYGGEEFAIILPNTGRSGSLVVAEQLRRAIEASTWEDRQITASVGVASMGEEITNGEELVDCADRALYRSKEAGRNCVSQGV